jgi:hypothetical protein
MTRTVPGCTIGGNGKCCKTGGEFWRIIRNGLVLYRVYLQQVAVSSNDWIIINNEMGVRCNEVAMAYFKVLSRYLSQRNSEKPRKYTVNRAFVPLKCQTAPSQMQFISEFISFDFSRRFSMIVHLVKFGLD